MDDGNGFFPGVFLVIVVLIIVKLLGGTQDNIYPQEVKAADLACQSFGGWKKFEGKFSNYPVESDQSVEVKATCIDGNVVSYKLVNKQLEK